MRLVAVPLAPLLRLIFAYDIRGLENIPDSGPYIIASNHISYIDPIVLIHVGMRFRKPKPPFYLRFLAKAELFEKQPMRFIMRSSKMIPVDRGTSQAKDSLVSARQALADGEVMCVFPEGTISLTLLPMAAYGGVGRLALDTGAPVVPAALWGTHRTWGKFHKREFAYHRPVTISFGAPRVFTEGSAQEVSRAVMEETVGLVDDARNTYPERPAPEDWWGPPEWPRAAAGRWRPKISKRMPPDEQVAIAHEAMIDAAESAGESSTGGAA